MLENLSFMSEFAYCLSVSICFVRLTLIPTRTNYICFLVDPNECLSSNADLSCIAQFDAI